MLREEQGVSKRVGAFYLGSRMFESLSDIHDNKRLIIDDED
jgi:hypothetical protein